MKRLLLCLLLCSVVLLCGCDNGKESGEEDKDSVTKAGSAWQWGPETELSFTEAEDGRVLVVNDQGQEVLDITEYPQADILVDNVTGVHRCIKTYTPNGTMMVPGEGEEDVEINVYSYNYYNTAGQPLEEDTSHSVFYIVGNMGYYTEPDYNSGVTNLATGDSYEIGYVDAYLTDNGFAAVAADTQETGESVFYFGDGEEPMHIEGQIAPLDYSTGLIGFTLWQRDHVLSYGSAPIYPGLEDYEYQGDHPREYEMDMKVSADNYPKPQAYFAFGIPYINSMDDPPTQGLVSSKGEIVLEPQEIKGFSLLDDGNIVVYRPESTELLDGKSWEVVKSLDFAASYYDGKNAIKQEDEFNNYLTDGDGNLLTGSYPIMSKIGVIDEAGDKPSYFQAKGQGVWDTDIMDGEGNILFTDRFKASCTYLGEGMFYIHSGAGKYIVDSTGKVVEMIRTWDGYSCNEQGVIEAVGTSY